MTCFLGAARLGFCALDLLWLNGDDLRGLPLHEHKKRLCELIPRSRKHGWFLAITSNVTVASFSHPRAAWTSRAMSRSSTCAIYGGRSPQHLHLNRESPTHKPKADMNSSRKCAIRPPSSGSVRTRLNGNFPAIRSFRKTELDPDLKSIIASSRHTP